MSDRLPLHKSTPPAAVVDIGSNSIRLVVYETSDRAPLPIFNEKILCGLGSGLDATGQLSPDGVEQALAALPRFMDVVDAMGVQQVDMLATAAVREASNGQDFVDRAQALCKRPVEVLSGEEEARLSGLGVLSGTPEADGVMGDLGGGSVELVELGDGKTGEQATLPLGPLRLDRKIITKPAKARAVIDDHLAAIPWLDRMKGRRFYVVGGAWRTFARLHMVHVAYPLHIIHHYGIRGDQVLDFADFVAQLSPNTLKKVHGVSKRRIGTLPYAAMLMHRIVSALEPTEVVFSANGLREGCLFDRLPPEERAVDPLVAACHHVAEHERTSAAVDGESLFEWMSPLMPNEDPRETRLRHAACMLSDIARWEHPDYRAEHALMRVMRLPVVGIDHPGRAFLALAVASRHAQMDERVEPMRAIAGVLDPAAMDRARAIGLSMRLAYTLSGGISRLLARFRIAREGDVVRLHVPDDCQHMVGEVVERRLGTLSKTLGTTYEAIRL